MITPGKIKDDFSEAAETLAKPPRSSLFKIISVLAALTISIGLLAGFFVWRRYHKQRVAIAPKPNANAARSPALPAKVQVYMDEPQRKGPRAIIGGTVHNISGEALSNISLEMELTRRKDAGTEMRSLTVDPKELAPDKKGRYTLALEGDYRSVKLLAIKSGPDSSLIGFKTAPGAARPAERVPETKTIVVDRPSSAPKQGEEFINTPDNPAKIP
jgi:hypothetical protein